MRRVILIPLVFCLCCAPSQTERQLKSLTQSVDHLQRSLRPKLTPFQRDSDAIGFGITRSAFEHLFNGVSTRGQPLELSFVMDSCQCPIPVKKASIQVDFQQLNAILRIDYLTATWADERFGLNMRFYLGGTMDASVESGSLKQDVEAKMIAAAALNPRLSFPRNQAGWFDFLITQEETIPVALRLDLSGLIVKTEVSLPGISLFQGSCPTVFQNSGTLKPGLPGLPESMSYQMTWTPEKPVLDEKGFWLQSGVQIELDPPAP